MSASVRATARLLSLSRHFSRPNYPPRPFRCMSTVPNQTTGAAAPAPAKEDVKAKVLYNFPVSEVPKANPLGEGNFIRTAGCLIIGYVVVCVSSV